jgi:hypothetical protein
MTYNDPSPAWRPEADESVLEAMAESLNEVFGRAMFARVDGGRLVVETANKTAWISADGGLVGAASTGPSDPS